MQLKTRISWNTYINKRKQANKICTQKKKKWLSNKIIQIGENRRRNETKNFFFEGIQNFKQQVTLPIICKDAEDNVISQTDLILARWKDYFCKILNTSEAVDIQNTIKECTNNQISNPTTII